MELAVWGWTKGKDLPKDWMEPSAAGWARLDLSWQTSVAMKDRLGQSGPDTSLAL